MCVYVFQPLDRSHGMANNFGQSQFAASSNPSISALPQSTTGKNHYSHGGPSPESSPVVPPHSLSPSITTNNSAKHKHSACQSVGSLPTFSNTNTNNFMSVSNADVSSCSQTSTSSKQQKDFVIFMDILYFDFSVFCTVKQWNTIYSVILLGDKIIRLQFSLSKHCLIVVPHILCNLIMSSIGSVFLCLPQILCHQLTMIFNINSIIRWG